MITGQKIATGFQNALEMAQQHGGLHLDGCMQSLANAVGDRLVKNSIAKETSYGLLFHLLANDRTVNVFVLTSGRCFITHALFSKLNESQLAGVSGHEIGHVIGRHSAERIAESKFLQTLTMGASLGGDLVGSIGSIGQNTLPKNGRG